ncbi:response regulator [Halovivax sp.]|uniref:response regulator n=1 Tax=Halovivax sp. TaxID=1935978 RepID=UPI0025C48981|nr:response regulator [Halovivax sp.]
MPPRRSSPARTLLLVEDNPGDARLIEEAFSPAVAEGLRVVSNGDEALDFVNRRGEYEGARPPDLILLDWHLPGTDGEEVLAELNAHPNHGHVPVIVLTGSQSEREVRDSYVKNANACITKAADPDELEETLRAFEEFWLSAARLPRSDGGP